MSQFAKVNVVASLGQRQLAANDRLKLYLKLPHAAQIRAPWLKDLPDTALAALDLADGTALGPRTPQSWPASWVRTP